MPYLRRLVRRHADHSNTRQQPVARHEVLHRTTARLAVREDTDVVSSLHEAGDLSEDERLRQRWK